MFEYLLNYGINKHTVDYEDLDINDRLALQDQINNVRKNYHNMLSLLDYVQGKYLECTEKLSKRTKDIISEQQGTRNNSVFNSDDEYLALEAEQTALKNGMTMINAQIDFYKNDLRILNSVFYNKF